MQCNFSHCATTDGVARPKQRLRNMELMDFLELMKKVQTHEEERIPAPQPTPIFIWSMTSMV